MLPPNEADDYMCSMQQDQAGRRSLMSGRVPKVAILVSHPTQFEALLYRFISRNGSIDLTVYFWTTNDIHELIDPELGHPPGWDFQPTDGYQWVLIPRGANRQWSFLRSHVFRPGEYDAIIVSGWYAPTARLALCAGLLTQAPLAVWSDTTLLYPRPFWKLILKNITLKVIFRFIPAFMVTGSLARRHHLHF